MKNVDAILREAEVFSTRAAEIEEAVAMHFPGHPDLRSLAGSLVGAANAFSEGLKMTTAPGRADSVVVPTAPVVEQTAAPAAAEGPEEVPGEVPGEAEEPRALSLAHGLVEIKQVIEQHGLVVDAQDSRFAEKASELIVKLTDNLDGASRLGQKAARVLFECVRSMDVLDRDYSLPGYEHLGEIVGRLRREVAEHLKESFGIEFNPDPCGPDSETLASLERIADAKVVKFPSNEPAGRVLALLRRGAKLPGGTEPPELLVSLGSSTPSFELAYEVARGLLAPAKLPPKLRQGRAAAAKEIKHKYLPQLASAGRENDRDREATVLRYVVNVLQPVNKDGSLNNLLRPCLSALAEHGFKAISAQLGRTFDDSFSTSKYERKSVPSSEPKGTIVEIVQIGFLNRDGVPVQKSTVGVSTGMPD